jgi:curved DNA-binding protein CbpA
MSTPDLYAVLGVDPTATQAEIDHAFRVLARRYHPDTRTDGKDADGNDLQVLLKAYGVLRNPKRRAAYDRKLRPSPNAGQTVKVHHRKPEPAQREPDLRVGPVRWHSRRR